jgi:hypothetical protein
MKTNPNWMNIYPRPLGLPINIDLQPLGLSVMKEDRQRGQLYQWLDENLADFIFFKFALE